MAPLAVVIAENGDDADSHFVAGPRSLVKKFLDALVGHRFHGETLMSARVGAEARQRMRIGRRPDARIWSDRPGHGENVGNNVVGRCPGPVALHGDEWLVLL